MEIPTRKLERVDGVNHETSTELEYQTLNSVSLERGAKGNVNIEVKCYDNDPNVASAKAVEIFNNLCQQYSVNI